MVEEGCTLRYAHNFLRTNYVSKLVMAYERDLGVTHDWNGTLRTVIPVRSDLVTQYMAFVQEEQKKAGVESRRITSTCTGLQPPRGNHRTHDTSHTVHT